uniref:glutathione transferase n=1 Tax=Paramoeba aestuarina TaxID=180227 RepID=A0A7S4L5N8_9EUKA|mmetsp:Transcript_31868/g.49875  ORF Transcript_31868/g.49875 Transcript_31868/m.49875 type:complete len:265 (+) Transcript_31868:135-929(+)
MASKGEDNKIPTLLYWNTRALAEPIRLLLAHLGVEYKDERLQAGPPPTYDKTKWNEMKKELREKMSFPNLPLWDDPERGVLMSQTNAILMYIADTYGLPCTAEERGHAHMILCAIREWFDALFLVTYCNYPWDDGNEEGVHVEGEDQALPSPGFESKRQRYITTSLPGYLSSFSAELNRNKGPWIGGTNLTFVDFIFWECLDQHLHLHSALFSDPAVANLKEYYDRFLSLPKIAAYRASPNFHAEPFHNRYSHFHRGWATSSNN